MGSICKKVVGIRGGRGGLLKSPWRSKSRIVTGGVCLAIPSGIGTHPNSRACPRLLKGARWARAGSPICICINSFARAVLLPGSGGGDGGPACSAAFRLRGAAEGPGRTPRLRRVVLTPGRPSRIHLAQLTAPQAEGAVRWWSRASRDRSAERLGGASG